jgi:hypothetical protein
MSFTINTNEDFNVIIDVLYKKLSHTNVGILFNLDKMLIFNICVKRVNVVFQYF